MKIALAQINPVVGDIPGNTRRVLQAIADARAAAARVLLLPELVLTGYPPEDLLLRPSLQPRIEQALAAIAAAAQDVGGQPIRIPPAAPHRRPGDACVDDRRRRRQVRPERTAGVRQGSPRAAGER